MRKILTWILWLILFAAVIAAGYFAWRFLTGGSSEEPAPEPVTVVCSPRCAESGQCGTTVEEPELQVVLGGKDGPVVEPQQHDVLFIAGSTVEIRNSMDVTLIDQEGKEFTAPFYRVEFRNAMGDIAETGWVPKWCTEEP